MNTIHRQALEHIKNNEWDVAHRLIQDFSDPLSCHIHAHLHRIEGDLANARYWYQRAGIVAATDSLPDEFTKLVAKATEISS